MRTVPGPTDRVVVVGAGLGGLSAALRLAGADREVIVVEAADRPGGRAGRLDIDGYHFDTGPTVLTMPEFIADALAAVGEEIGDWLTLDPVEPAYRARFADGSAIDVHADADAMTDEIARNCGPADAAGYRRFVDYLQGLYQAERSTFIDRNLDRITDLVRPEALTLLRLGALRRLDRTVAGYFADERLRRIFSFQSLYAGLAPQQALTIYAVIAYMDCVRGVFFPRGGIHAVPMALAGAAAKHGVQFRFGTTVGSIEIDAGRARAVITTAGERIRADAVVVNADLPTAYRELIPAEYRPRRVDRLRYSPSCVLMHAGTTSAPDGGRHHTIEFGHSWSSTFAELGNGRLMSDPSALIGRPTLSDPTMAPPGGHAWYVLLPAPNLVDGADIDWSTLGPRYQEEILAWLATRGYRELGADVEVSRWVTPADWAAVGLAAGAPFSARHSLGQTGPFRLPTLDRRVENLVFCGANTQPGVGVPMVLLSGRLAAERIVGATR